MPSKKTEELNAMSVEELHTELEESRTALQKMKFEHAIRGLENPLIIRNVRRDIARILTMLREREIKEMTPDQLANRSKIRSRRRK